MTTVMTAKLKHFSAGFTLVELLVAMIIGLLLIGGVIQIVTSSRAAYQEAQRFAILHENMWFASDFLARDIRGATDVNFTHEILTVTRTRQLNQCGAQADSSTATPIAYTIVNGALRCNNQELIRGLDPDYSGSWVEDHLNFLIITLPFQSIGANKAIIDEQLQFRVALRNRILADYHSAP